ncbi:MAG: DivIVA domain-containing protein [Defluviitaleaceae bacterium]|nr:DivIVA domain-containing protein [Defluviitaleaceae bacterium]
MPDKFGYVKRGYDPAAVDARIEKLEAEIKAMKDRETIINTAIVSAQQASVDIVKNAKNQGRIIRENTAKQLEDIATSVDSQRQLLGDFTREYNAVAEKYLKFADSDEFKAAFKKIDELESMLRNYSEEVTEDLEIEKKAATIQ